MTKRNSEAYRTKGIVVFSLLTREECETIINELKKFPLKKAPKLKGKFVQRYHEATVSIEIAPKTQETIRKLERELKRNSILSAPDSFNSFFYHVYDFPEPIGIEKHRDGRRFQNPIAIIVLRDGGEFYRYEGAQKKLISATAGDCILMDNATEYSMLNVNSRRNTLACRIDTTPGEKL